MFSAFFIFVSISIRPREHTIEHTEVVVFVYVLVNRIDNKKKAFLLPLVAKVSRVWRDVIQTHQRESSCSIETKKRRDT